MVRVFAPATIGNVGPGFDVLGLSFEGLGDIISLELTGNSSSIDSIVGRDAQKIPTDPKKNCAVIAAEELLRIKGVDKGVRISIERELPVSGGLGASAASCVGAAMAAAAAAEVKATPEELLLASLAGEEMVAGRHLDNIAPCLFGGFTLVLSVSPPKVFSLPINNKWWLCVATPDCHVETKEARKVLPSTLATETWVSQMKNSIGITAALAAGNTDLASSCFEDYFSEPNRKHLIEGHEDIKKIFMDSGAIGCSISGSGPTMFAIVESEAKAKSCKAAIELGMKADSIQVDICALSQKGAHII